MNYVYLAGPITGFTVDQARERRALLAERLREHGLTPLDPMRNITTHNDEAPASPMDEVHPQICRDFRDIKRSGLIVLDLRGAKRVSIGSMIEVGYATAFEVPILVVDEIGSGVHSHPWMRAIPVGFVTDETLAAEFAAAYLEP